MVTYESFSLFPFLVLFRSSVTCVAIYGDLFLILKTTLQVKLVEVEKVEWVNKKSYSTVALVLQDRDYRILLRTNDGLEDWFELLEVSTL